MRTSRRILQAGFYFIIIKIRVSKGCSQISYWQIAQRQASFCDFEETLENLSMPFCPQ